MPTAICCSNREATAHAPSCQKATSRALRSAGAARHPSSSHCEARGESAHLPPPPAGALLERCEERIQPDQRGLGEDFSLSTAAATLPCDLDREQQRPCILPYKTQDWRSMITAGSQGLRGLDCDFSRAFPRLTR